ncbi:MAG TPA: hypothetical protein PL108_03560 [Sediminibacterium sp.]|jgi:hypothetical protein|uniref:hypothetical protein n=1 Tax=Sediminibacterium sp. TaxID=1917865 RepID=UPI001B73FFFE|nr:hypothetical protein [Sediminibacterium sp.]MBP7346241.1 hypothetical protein [Sediminibacterium sp.]HPH36712.1 hypothetical protein [Sediminibacterium sp.]
MKKFAWSATTIILLVLAIVVYWRFYFVYSEGTKAGILNTFQQKGFVFKTYEGNLIQSGFKANVQSNEFVFSVVDEKVANVLNQNSGREINVHYKRYLGALPWRGVEKYIVDSILEVRGVGNETIIAPKNH